MMIVMQNKFNLNIQNTLCEAGRPGVWCVNLSTLTIELLSPAVIIL